MLESRLNSLVSGILAAATLAAPTVAYAERLPAYLNGSASIENRYHLLDSSSGISGIEEIAQQKPCPPQLSYLPECQQQLRQQQPAPAYVPPKPVPQPTPKPKSCPPHLSYLPECRQQFQPAPVYVPPSSTHHQPAPTYVSPASQPSYQPTSSFSAPPEKEEKKGCGSTCTIIGGVVGGVCGVLLTMEVIAINEANERYREISGGKEPPEDSSKYTNAILFGTGTAVGIGLMIYGMETD